jgi:hypothetical protein
MSAPDDDILSPYDSQRIRFVYPAAWDLHEELSDSDTVISITADDSCFCILRLMPARPRPPEVVRSCVRALRAEYEEVELTRPEAIIDGLPTCSREATFSCFELLNAAGFYSARSRHDTLLIWWQCTDHELPAVRPLFDRLIQSVRIRPSTDAADRPRTALS